MSMPLLIENRRELAAQKATLLLLAALLSAIELALPRLPFFPWLKPGFANIITIIWIVKYGFADALLFTALRIWISGFYFGFSLFTLLLSASGGLLSTAAMAVLYLALGKRKLVGAVGMAIVGALFHNAGQLGVVYFMMSFNMSVLGQVPFMLAASLVFGSITGGLAPVVFRLVNDSKDINDENVSLRLSSGEEQYEPNLALTAGAGSGAPAAGVTLTFAVSVTLMFVQNIYALVISAIVFSLVALALNPKKVSVLVYPFKFYMLFIFVAVTHLFFSYGMRIEFLPFITNEGLLAFVKQSLRLWCWLQTVHIFTRFNFSAIFMRALTKLFPHKNDTLLAGMIALKHFPDVIRARKSNRKISIAAIITRPKTVIAEYIREMRAAARAQWRVL